MTERMIWGIGPYPAGAMSLGVVQHPVDGAFGALLQLASGQLVHGAAGVLRTIDVDKLAMSVPRRYVMINRAYSWSEWVGTFDEIVQDILDNNRPWETDYSREDFQVDSLGRLFCRRELIAVEETPRVIGGRAHN